MATESLESEKVKITGGNQHLIVEDDLREMGKQAAWTVSSCKTGNGVSSLRDDNLETYWQLNTSDGAQPHLVNIQFQKKVKLQLVVLYVDFKLDESYTPSKISIRAGDGFHNLRLKLWSLSSLLVGFIFRYPEMILVKLLSIPLCCKLWFYQITLMGGILMFARSKFMDLNRTLFPTNHSSLLQGNSLHSLSGNRCDLAWGRKGHGM